MKNFDGDEVVISDDNFPAASVAKNLVRLDGLNVTEVLDAILSVMPLDTYVESPVGLMELSGGDTEIPPIWSTYKEIIEKHQPCTKIETIERFDYYERAKKPTLLFIQPSRQYTQTFSSKKE